MTISAPDLYAAYNAGGDPTTANLNFRGEPCPTWADLPPNVRAKWEAVRDACLPRDLQDGLDFGSAIAALKRGERVAREGWHGKNMWLKLIRAGNAMHTSRHGAFDMQDCIGLKTPAGTMQPGWNASTPDVLATDWMIVEERT